MSKYNGNTAFDFEIERFYNEKGLIVDELFSQDNLTCKLITLQVDGSSYFEPGIYYGPWEDSYPDQGETLIESILGPDQKDWFDALTSSEIECILSLVAEKCYINFY